MALIDFDKKEIQCKIVYYGPGRSGKTTNLIYIYNALPAKFKGKFLTIESKGEHTLLFELLPLSLGKIKDLTVRLQLYTVPGQALYKQARKMVLKGVDGVVFVADSLRVRRDKNKESLEDLREHLSEWQMDIHEIPLVFQYNKRDLGDLGIPILSVEELQEDLNFELKAPYFEAIALKGVGVLETLKAISKMSVHYIAQKYLK
ncbi:MAG: gliding motility protein [Thermodesulfatator sp.]|nr:MAG: gliding motility protein [Thermodesulfatator sp.]